MRRRMLRRRYGRGLFGGVPSAPAVGASVKYKGMTIENPDGKYRITAPKEGQYHHSSFDGVLKEVESMKQWAREERLEKTAGAVDDFLDRIDVFKLR